VWQIPKMCEPDDFGPHVAVACATTKDIRLDFWAAFLWYFLFLQKESKRKIKIL
jgi:hypothetical protein